jgi:hypothetical protein
MLEQSLMRKTILGTLRFAVLLVVFMLAWKLVAGESINFASTLGTSAVAAVIYGGLSYAMLRRRAAAPDA